MNYQTFQTILRSTCCHRVNLFNSQGQFIGVYNGLAQWGRVFSPVNGSEYNGLVEVASLASDEHFTVQDFVDAGYSLANE
jgi:hypothetical protein